MAALSFALTVATGLMCRSVSVLTVGFSLTTLLGFAGLLRSVGIARRSMALGAAVPWGTVAWLVLGNGFMTGIGALGAFASTITFSRGRQLRRWGRIQLPALRRDDAAWTALHREFAVPDALPERRELAARWRENGKSEHASVAAFARLSLDLLALGAPPALAAAANRDALDEIRHAELCFALARAIDGEAASPGPFPAAGATASRSAIRAVALAQLAVDSLVDGALHEGVSARVVARLAKRAELPAVRAVLREIAADEGRHAAHGWDVVAWCLAQGGDAVADALRGALLTLPATMATPLPPAARDGGWERFGIHGRALEAEEYARARADLVRRVTALVARPARAAA